MPLDEYLRRSDLSFDLLHENVEQNVGCLFLIKKIRQTVYKQLCIDNKVAIRLPIA